MANKEILLGAHVSIVGGIDKSILRGEEINATAIQIFTKSSRSWTTKKLTTDEIKKFKDNWKNSKIVKVVVAHTSYLINLAAKNPDVEKKSIKSLALELERCEELGIPFLVLHPGALVGQTEEIGLAKISKNLDLVLKNSKGITSIALETMAGQGTCVGHTFEQLKAIRSKCKEKNKIKICMDTCHIFAAGYDISTEKSYNEVMNHFEKILGKTVLKIIHLNDSKGALGSRVDRHANIGKGKIPKQTFSWIMNDKRFTGVPKILETPVQNLDDYIPEIKMLRKMVKD